MVAEKTGCVEFYAHDPATGRMVKVPARHYLTPRQELLMAQDPFLIQLLARKISADRQAQRQRHPEVTGNAFATLNGRPSQRIINPEADLARGASAAWILPLREE